MEKAPGDSSDTIRSRRVITYVPLPALAGARERAGFMKKEPSSIGFNPVTEVAWSQEDSHHIEGCLRQKLRIK